MYEIGDEKTGPVIVLGQSPFRKRPTIGIRNGSVLTSLGYFRDEESMAKFMKAMYHIFPLQPPKDE